LLLHTSGSYESSDRVRLLAGEYGWDEATLAARIEALLRFLMKPFLPHCQAFVFSGGATAQWVFRLLGADGPDIHGHEIFPGAPLAPLRGGAFNGRPFPLNAGARAGFGD